MPICIPNVIIRTKMDIVINDIQNYFTNTNTKIVWDLDTNMNMKVDYVSD